ncbi:MAG: Single-stranded DNA-specific exonuclease RecJ [Candidatus Methanohalarchaeum thermophilum]|uniref:Single-stranded DNA-specific exonuclease RecJ n=1 Tax=Methanohalarchaeum thermophilum TaxID=1903181 RepID=A0A1Q6DV59_METT1|nr:MAG: Single-stranded DNA-specific exonuclease RecJ [Candidatus Methanohalarchaeum thermophilum]
MVIGSGLMGFNGFYEQAKKCSNNLNGFNGKVQVVSHIDADGLTSAGIISKTLKREGITHDVDFVKSLDKEKIEDLADQNPEFIIFTDLGSNLTNKLKELNSKIIISDHHEPLNEKENNILHLNPHLFGINGANELSGAGTTFFLSKALNKNNTDLADLAITGSIGDLQDSKGRLEGINRKIIKIGEKNNIIECKKDLRLFGKQTRPVYKLLEHANDPYIPGITGNKKETIKFLNELDISLKNGERWRRWINLTQEEKKKIISKLIHYCLSNNVPNEETERLVGEVYILLKEEPGTELRDASEFSTLLNATARYGHSQTGLKLCLGDRNEAYKKAKKLLKQHRRNLMNGLDLVRNKGVNKLSDLQYFDLKNEVRDTIVGIIAGMSVNLDSIDRDLPVIAFAEKDEDNIKVSSRATQKLIFKGLDLGKALQKASSEVNGEGGGHDIAAGATIPKGKKEEFINKLNKIINHQL